MLRKQRNRLRLIVFCHLIITVFPVFSQQKPEEILSLEEFIGYVKSYHPVVKQAELILSEGEANLMKARGAFDPKLEVDFDKKMFESSEYFNRLNATFKIPTWYGIDVKGNYEQNTGIYLNPESTVPEDGLYSVGVSVSLAKGLLINERMAMLKQAKLLSQQAAADMQLEVNAILFDAFLAYFNWLKAYNDKQVYATFLTNSKIRFEGIKKNFEVGERPAIDTVEAKIAINTRKLNLEKAKIVYLKSTLGLSNFLWINDTPVELQEHIIPNVDTSESVDQILSIQDLNVENVSLETHPKIQSLQLKYKQLEIDKRLRLNNLLPQVDLEYNFLSATGDVLNSYSTSNYKTGVTVSMPLFLRKERGDLKLSKLKLQDTKFEIQATTLSLKNKLRGIAREIDSYLLQTSITESMVSDYSTLLKAEERKFDLGESSLFLINSRESKLIEAQIKLIEVQNTVLVKKASLFNAFGVGI